MTPLVLPQVEQRLNFDQRKSPRPSWRRNSSRKLWRKASHSRSFTCIFMSSRACESCRKKCTNVLLFFLPLDFVGMGSTVTKIGGGMLLPSGSKFSVNGRGSSEAGWVESDWWGGFSRGGPCKSARHCPRRPLTPIRRVVRREADWFAAGGLDW